MDKMTSSKPYLIRAVYDWIVDNDLTPYLLVDALYEGVLVPESFVQGGKIVLNISPSACRGLHIENDKIVFSARFSGVTTQIFIKPGAVLSVYAKENGRGMEFALEYEEDIPPPKAPSPLASGGVAKPKLKLVK
jgi:stringent starvation protein B